MQKGNSRQPSVDRMGGEVKAGASSSMATTLDSAQKKRSQKSYESDPKQ